jgi:hypothetical protein
LAEEEVADHLLTELARELMSQACTGLSNALKGARATTAADEK